MITMLMLYFPLYHLPVKLSSTYILILADDMNGMRDRERACLVCALKDYNFVSVELWLEKPNPVLKECDQRKIRS